MQYKCIIEPRAGSMSLFISFVCCTNYSTPCFKNNEPDRTVDISKHHHSCTKTAATSLDPMRSHLPLYSIRLHLGTKSNCQYVPSRQILTTTRTGCHNTHRQQKYTFFRFATPHRSPSTLATSSPVGIIAQEALQSSNHRLLLRRRSQ